MTDAPETYSQLIPTGQHTPMWLEIDHGTARLRHADGSADPLTLRQAHRLLATFNAIDTQAAHSRYTEATSLVGGPADAAPLDPQRLAELGLNYYHTPLRLIRTDGTYKDLTRDQADQLLTTFETITRQADQARYQAAVTAKTTATEQITPEAGLLDKLGAQLFLFRPGQDHPRKFTPAPPPGAGLRRSVTQACPTPHH